MRRYCLALDLKDDPQLIAEYKKYHEAVWPEIEESITKAGVTSMEIYNVGNRLFMIIEVTDTFSFENWDEVNGNTPKSSEWETLMWNYQQALPFAKPGEKWMLMEKIYQL